jgi:hypothetical protein
MHTNLRALRLSARCALLQHRARCVAHAGKVGRLRSMKLARLILSYLLFGVASSVCIAGVAAVLWHPHGHNGASVVVKLDAPGEPKDGTCYLTIWHTSAITETEAVVAAFPRNDLANEPLDRARLPGWCRIAMRPWTTGVRPWPAQDCGDWRIRDEAGWPLRCLSLEFGPRYSCPRSSWNNSPIELHGGIELRRRGPDITGVPYRPLWAGLILDSVLFAGCSLVLSKTTCALRRYKRRTRGDCSACGYDRGGLAADAKCPECGTPPAK